jgi:hypothetical protein
MKDTYNVPKDYARRTEFRKLWSVLRGYGATGAMSLAHHLFHALFTELSYQAHRNALGCIPKGEFAEWFDTVEQADIVADQAIEAFKFCGLLVEETDRYVSYLFYEHNDHLSRYYTQSNVKAADMSAFKARKRRVNDLLSTSVKAVNPARFVDPDGKRIEEPEVKQIFMVIGMVDGILGRVERDEDDYGVGLITDTCRALRATGVKNMEIVLIRLMNRRFAPGTPRTTERFFEHFDTNLKRLEPDSGWGEWSLILRKTQAEEPL